MSYSATAHDRYFEQMENEYMAQYGDDEEEDDYEPEALEPEEDRVFEDEDERKLKLAEMEGSCEQNRSNIPTAQSIPAS